MLGGKHDGYDILIAYVKKDSLRWLYDKYTNQEREHQAKQRAIEKALKYGNVPMEPMFYIQRQSMVSETKLKTNFIAGCPPHIWIQTKLNMF